MSEEGKCAAVVESPYYGSVKTSGKYASESGYSVGTGEESGYSGVALAVVECDDASVV